MPSSLLASARLAVWAGIVARARRTMPGSALMNAQQHGRGLGLAAVQGIIRSHHGALRLTTTPSRGTTFTVWFPLDTASAARRHA
jgi:nitrogen-specific signal transduction histidine kinase